MMHVRKLRLILAAAALGAMLHGAADAHADPDSSLGPNCDTVAWGPFGALGYQHRSVCDGPIRPDGSWSRKRAIWTEAHHVPVHCSTFGNNSGSYSYSTTNCSGGYDVDEDFPPPEEYVVTPDTIPPGEPGHLG